MLRLRVILPLTVLLTLMAQPVAAAQVVFMDSTFDNGDWASSFALTIGPPPSFSAAQAAAGGNPAEYRTVQHTFGGNGTIVVGHLFDVSVYNPSLSGAIESIDAGFDLILHNGGQSSTVAYGIFLTQNGNLFIGADRLTSIAPVTNVWVSHSIPGLEALSFRPLPGSSGIPDFSLTGGEIQFGYFTSNGTGAATQTTTISGIDNWMVTLNTGAAPVPVPGALLLIAAPALFSLRRRPR